MIVFAVSALLIALSGMKVQGAKQFEPDYISKNQTVAVNGFFTLLVFLSHCSTYIDLGGALDEPYVGFKRYIGQLIVASFLFYSGYGMMQSISKKGSDYVRSIPTKHFLRILYHSELAILLYIIVDLLIKKPLSVKKVLYAAVFWKGIGNSSWYIFVILSLYLIVFVSFSVAKEKKYLGVAMTGTLSLCLVYFLIHSGKSVWWYNTVMLYPFGMMFSLFREKIEKLLMKNDILYLFFFALFGAAFYFSSLRKEAGIYMYWVWSACFMMMLVMLTMKVTFKNKVLDRLGSHVFSIYILQRIPMLVLEKIGLNEKKYVYVLLCFILTLALSAAFDKALGKLDEIVYSKKKNNRQA